MEEWVAASQLLGSGSVSQPSRPPADSRATSSSYGASVGGLGEGAWNVNLGGAGLGGALAGALGLSQPAQSSLLPVLGLALVAGLTVALVIKWKKS